MAWLSLPVVLLILNLCTISSHGKLHSRELKLNCTPDEFNTEEEPDAIVGRFDAFSTGSTGVELIGRLRSKPQSFYQNIVNQVIMYVCDTEVASERCVDEDSPFAAKDWKGNCIEAADYTCPLGTCERSSNCYWNTVVEGQNRTTRFPQQEYERAESALVGQMGDISLQYNSYGGGIVIFALVGAIVSLLLLVLWVIFFIGRYLCCCLWTQAFCFLCSPIPKDEYRTCQDILFPVLFYLAAGVAIVTATALAFIGNEDISIATSNAFLHADGLVTDLMRFLGRSSIPLENVESIVVEAGLEAKGIFDGTDFVKRDALKIVASFLGFYAIHSQGLNASGTLDGFDSATTGFDSQVTPITDNVQSLLDTLELDLYDKADFIRAGLVQAMGQLDSFSKQASGWQEKIYEYEGQEMGTRDMRQLAVMVLFLVALSLAVLGLFGIVLSKTRLCSICNHMIKIVGFFSAIFGPIALLAASVGLSANFILHDACKISDIVVQDFEPFVGDLVAPAANGAFNDTNLAVALNLTEKVNFQNKLDEGLSQIRDINVTASFDKVLDPLKSIQSMLGSISDTSLSILNTAVTADEFPCAFADEPYTKEDVMYPWSVSRPTAETAYIVRDNFGNPTPYSRLGLEAGEDYMARVYSIAGVCTSSSDCCIYEDPMPPACESSQYAPCDFGANCAFPCTGVQTAIVQGYNAFLHLYDIELNMTADLGVQCPESKSCPTEGFKSQYSNLTLVGSLEDYRGKISATKDSLVNLASTSVGDTMIEVEDFLCSMNISFVESRYDELKADICGSLFGGFAQIEVAFFIVGIGLEVVAIVCSILAVRLMHRYDETDDYDVDGEKGLGTVNLY